MITRAKELADKYGADVTYEVMDAMELSYADETFDVVITRNLTWTLPDIQKAYKEWHRVLKKGGLLLNYDANYARMNSLEKTIIKDDDKTAQWTSGNDTGVRRKKCPYSPVHGYRKA